MTRRERCLSDLSRARWDLYRCSVVPEQVHRYWCFNAISAKNNFLSATAPHDRVCSHSPARAHPKSKRERERERERSQPFCLAKTSTLDIMHKLLNQFVHRSTWPASGAIDFQHHNPLSVISTVAGSHNVHGRENLLASCFSHIQLSGRNLMWCWSESSWKFWCYFWLRFDESKKIIAVLRLPSTNFNVGMHSDVSEPLLFIYSAELHILILVQVTMPFIQVHMGAAKNTQKKGLLLRLSHKVRHRFGWNVVCCVRLVGLVNVIFILPRPFSIRGRNPNLGDFVRK